MNQQTLINKFESIGYQPVLSTTTASVLTREYEPDKHCGQIIFKDGECATLQSQDVERVLNNEEINMQKYTKNDILGMSDKERTNLYNEVTGKSVKRVQKSNGKAVDAILAAQEASSEKEGSVSSSVKRPKEGSVSETIWILADAMETSTRAEVVAACVSQGINRAPLNELRWAVQPPSRAFVFMGSYG
jgi:hypothetical protein